MMGKINLTYYFYNYYRKKIYSNEKFIKHKYEIILNLKIIKILKLKNGVEVRKVGEDEERLRD